MSARELQEYGDAAYWDLRYSEDGGPFDWYQRYSGLKTILENYVSKNSKVLMIGCGNALTTEEMVQDGYEDITNIDISAVVIEAMQQKYADRPQLQYMTMDAREMTAFEDGTFDAVIDKGLLDSLLCGAGAQASAAKMLGEVLRVLRQGGVYILVTHGEPKQRVPHLRQPDVLKWGISLHVVPKPGCKSKQADPTNQWDCLETVPLPEDPAEGDAAELSSPGKGGKGKDAKSEGKKGGKGAEIPAEGKKDGKGVEGKKDAKVANSKTSEANVQPDAPGKLEEGPEPRSYLQYYGEMDVHYVYVHTKEGGSSKGKDSKAAKGKEPKADSKAKKPK